MIEQQERIIEMRENFTPPLSADAGIMLNDAAMRMQLFTRR